MMLELLTGPLGLLLVAAVIWWGITFNTRLRERYGCTACTFWGVTGGRCGNVLLDAPLGKSAELGIGCGGGHRPGHHPGAVFQQPGQVRQVPWRA